MARYQGPPHRTAPDRQPADRARLLCARPAPCVISTAAFMTISLTAGNTSWGTLTRTILRWCPVPNAASLCRR